YRAVDPAVDPCHQGLRVGTKFDNGESRRIFSLIERAGGGKAASAIFHCKANIRTRLVPLLVGYRPDHVSPLVRAESDPRPAFFTFDRFYSAVNLLRSGPCLAAIS